jgi:hypothetical protein
MTRATTRLLGITLATIAGILCLFASENISLTRLDRLVTQAQARIGRPLTPLSYAGVARRTVRRGVWAGAAVGAAAPYYGAPAYAAPVYAAPGCVQVVNAYGQIVYQCP